MQRWYKTSGRASSIAQQLPESLMQRLEPLIARDKAQLLWMSRRRFQVTTEIRQTLETVFQVLQDKTYHWAAPIAHLIPRDHHFVSVGDASNVGGGAYCEQLQFWFDIRWSKKTRRALALSPSSKDFVHINCLEFTIVILQFAACITRLRTCKESQRATMFPYGVPNHPIMLCRTDNTSAEAWALTTPRLISLH
jgi:hypothetical protein